ncbi:MAG: hypothetical protein J6Y01_02865 [Spirochaetales bacterium]|nr:hypothetical protein [Spirochaetales bacterium]
MENLNQGTLTIEAVVNPDKKVIELIWKGKSVDLKPDGFLLPYYDKIIAEAKNSGCSIDINFYHLIYMNSSTINSIIYFIKKLIADNIHSKVIYNKNLKWQELNFSTLKIFVTENGLFDIEERKQEWQSVR